jgi:ATP-dependent Lhr-like helicase
VFLVGKKRRSRLSRIPQRRRLLVERLAAREGHHLFLYAFGGRNLHIGLAQRRFREIARVAGLVFGGYPGAPKSMKQLQASSSLFWAALGKYDAGNRLLTQAEQALAAQGLELARLRSVLGAMAAATREGAELKAASPLCLPLMVERLREQLSTEKLQDRLQRLLAGAERALDAPPRRRGRMRP